MQQPTAQFAFPELQSARTCLRLLTLDDAEAVYQHFSHPDVTRYMDIEPLTSFDEAREIIEFHRQDAGCRWGIFDRKTSQLLGTCGYHAWYRDTSPETAEIGYDLGKPHWGQGLMYEVLREVIPFGFDQMMLNRIEADPLPDNRRSIRLLARLGFQSEPKRRDGQQWYELFKDDWSRQRGL